MSIAITARQRDLLYDEILDRLSGIGDVWLAVCAKDFERAGRLALAYSDDLRIVGDDLGWGDAHDRAPIELTTPPDVLRRALARMRDGAQRLDASEEAERSQLRANQEHNQLVAETCRQLLADLDAA